MYQESTCSLKCWVPCHKAEIGYHKEQFHSKLQTSNMCQRIKQLFPSTAVHCLCRYFIQIPPFFFFFLSCYILKILVTIAIPILLYHSQSAYLPQKMQNSTGHLPSSHRIPKAKTSVQTPINPSQQWLHVSLQVRKTFPLLWFSPGPLQPAAKAKCCSLTPPCPWWDGEGDVINVPEVFWSSALLQCSLDQSMANGGAVLPRLGQSIPGVLHTLPNCGLHSAAKGIDKNAMSVVVVCLAAIDSSSYCSSSMSSTAALSGGVTLFKPQ